MLFEWEYSVFWILCFLSVMVSAVVLTIWPAWAIRTAITMLIYFINFSTVFVLLSIEWSVLWIMVWSTVRAIVWSVVWTMMSVLWSRPIAMIWPIMMTVLGVTTMSVMLVFVCMVLSLKRVMWFLCVFLQQKRLDHLLPWPKWPVCFHYWVHWCCEVSNLLCDNFDCDGIVKFLSWFQGQSFMKWPSLPHL